MGTHTVVGMEVSSAAYKEIKGLLEAAGYQHAFMPEGEIDMSGIAIVDGGPEVPPTNTLDGHCGWCGSKLVDDQCPQATPRGGS